MYKWLLPTLSEILAWVGADSSTSPTQETITLQEHQRHTGADPYPRAVSLRLRQKAQREWRGAIAALEHLLKCEICDSSQLAHTHSSSDQLLHPSVAPTAVLSNVAGLVLSGPVPILSQAELIDRFSTWTFTADSLNPLAWQPAQLLPVQDGSQEIPTPALPTLAIVPNDPLTKEQFCVVFTTKFSLVLVLGENAQGEPAFMYSFEPEILHQVWQALRIRVLFSGGGQHLNKIESLYEQFAPTIPDYKIVMKFGQLLLQYLPEVIPSENSVRIEEEKRKPDEGRKEFIYSESCFGNGDESAKDCHVHATIPNHGDVELLQAIAHEVRTPLSTIRTLTRLLLKRKDLAPEAIKRLEMIDRECSEQIDRFGLIFRAVELETSEKARSPMQLTSTSLAQVFNSCIPRWQKQATRRNHTLDVILPQKMPKVVSDPTMLDQVLTGLIDNFTASLNAGSHVQVQVMLAGDQLKVQLHSQDKNKNESPLSAAARPLLKSVGQLLMFQPETGNLSLNLAVTKNLFQALGGKLIVRQRPEQGEVLTIFLPLEIGSTHSSPLNSQTTIQC